MAKSKSGKPTVTEQLLEAGTQVSALWMEFRKHFRKAFTNQEIDQAEEQRFLELKSDITRLQRILAQNLPEGFDYNAARIGNVMTQAISIDTLRDMPLKDKKSLYDEWHAAYISIQNMLGVIDTMAEGHHVTFSVKKVGSGNIKQSLSGSDEEQKKSGGGKAMGIVAAIAVVGFLVWYFVLK